MLKLTKTADYGLIALKHMAVNSADASSSAKAIAECYGIPLPLLAKILQKLTKIGLLQSLPGTNGGYLLARERNKINPLEVIRAINGPIILTACFTAHGECAPSEKCTVPEPPRKVPEGSLNMLNTI